MSLSSLEAVLIAQQISDISVLGLLLQFEQTQVDAFHEENVKDSTIKKGTQTMLNKWYQKDGSTKEKLVEALRLSGMGELAERVKQGIVPDEYKKFLELDAKASDTVSTVPQSGKKSSFDDILKTVARKVVKNNEIDDLGSALGLEVADRERYIATNSRYQDITYSGTLDMLRSWQKKQTQSTERSALKTALIASGNIRLADQIFGEGQTTSGALASASGGIPSALLADREVSSAAASDAVPNVKLNTLATHAPHGKYSELSEKLGIEYNQSTAILAKHNKDFTEAMRECLAIWKNRTGGSSAKLKEILYSAEVGGTLVQYIV